MSCLESRDDADPAKLIKAGGRTVPRQNPNYFFPSCWRFIPRVATMSAATDKARFYLEQSVPELKEYERKEIFSKVPFHVAYTYLADHLTFSI